MTKYPCELIQDLLPLYHDNVCAPKTAQAVEEHLQGCEACQEVYHAFDSGPEPERSAQEEEHQVRAFKKVRGRFRRRALGMCLGAVIGIGLGISLLGLCLDRIPITLPEDLISHVRIQCSNNYPNSKKDEDWLVLNYNLEYESKYYQAGKEMALSIAPRIDGKQEFVLLFSRRVSLWESFWSSAKECFSFGDVMFTDTDGVIKWPKTISKSDGTQITVEACSVVGCSWKNTWQDKHVGIGPPESRRNQGMCYFTAVYFAPDCSLLDELSERELTPEEQGEIIKKRAIPIWDDTNW